MAMRMDHQLEGRGSLSERVYLSIRDSILSLELAPGSRVDKKSLAETLGVSLFPVSEAVGRLSAEGIVDVYPQAGTYITPFSMLEIREGAFLREALECAAAERVADRASEDQIAGLRRNLRLQEVLSSEGDCAGFFKLDEEMHDILFAATGFAKLTALSETLWLHLERARRLFSRTPGSTQIAFEEHRAIVEAISRRDADGARTGMKKHIRRVTEELFQLESRFPGYFTHKKGQNGKRPA